jgi:hypothetical protein
MIETRPLDPEVSLPLLVENQGGANGNGPDAFARLVPRV